MLSQDHRNSFTSLLRSVASETSASEDQVVEFLVKSIQEVLSQDTGLDLHLEFIPESYSINVYSIRLVKDDPIGFGEITQDNALTLSKERLGFFTDDCFYHFLRQISLDLDTGFFSRVSVSQIAGRLGVHMDRLKRQREYDLFKERQGDLISGTVTRIETGGNIIVNLGLAEGFLSKFEILPNEFFSIGSTVQAYIYEVSLSTDKYQIKLSRTRNEFLAHLMASFVPEIANNLITIKAISREPGSRSKVAVFSEDETVDPVGACIGRDGIRIKAVRGAIGNERIDIIP